MQIYRNKDRVLRIYFEDIFKAGFINYKMMIHYRCGIQLEVLVPVDREIHLEQVYCPSCRKMYNAKIQEGFYEFITNEEADELRLKLVREAFKELKEERETHPKPMPTPEKTKPFTFNEKLSEILVCISLIFGMVLILLLLFIIW